MLMLRGTEVRLHACPLTDDDMRFDLGNTLQAALETPVAPVHARCALCRGPGVDYAGPAPVG
jgi:hypothetical protein